MAAALRQRIDVVDEHGKTILAVPVGPRFWHADPTLKVVASRDWRRDEPPPIYRRSSIMSCTFEPCGSTMATRFSAVKNL